MTGHASSYISPVLGSAFHSLVAMTRHCSVYSNAGLATLDATVDDLVTVTGYLSIYDNDELALLGAAFSSLATVTGYTSVQRTVLFPGDTS